MKINLLSKMLNWMSVGQGYILLFRILIFRSLFTYMWRQLLTLSNARKQQLFHLHAASRRSIYTLKEKMGHFDLNSWVTGGTKIRPGFRVIREYLSQILVPPVTQLFRSNWQNLVYRKNIKITLNSNKNLYKKNYCRASFLF